jgi:hypothetical protein
LIATSIFFKAQTIFFHRLSFGWLI